MQFGLGASASDQLEAQAQTDDQVIADLSERVAVFERTVDELVDLYQQASDELVAAEEKLALAKRAGDESSRAFQQAASDYEAASRNWRLVTVTLLAAANWDYAGHLCDTRMTTAAYRKMLREQGVDLDGLDADHGLPKSLGGADNPLNYRMIDSSLNRSGTTLCDQITRSTTGSSCENPNFNWGRTIGGIAACPEAARGCGRAGFASCSASRSTSAGFGPRGLTERWVSTFGAYKEVYRL